jgi:hypothetical protein
MQFTSRKRIVFFGVIVFSACALSFGSGLLVARQFPTHRFERVGNSLYLLDPKTGKVCNALKDPHESSNIFNQALGAPAPRYADYPPACGK